jgi:hypothetical protein
MDLFVSNISILNRLELVPGLLVGRWPSFERLLTRSKSFGARGLQVAILQGWRVEDLIFYKERDHRDICAIEGPWHGESDTPDLVSLQLFGHDAHAKTTELINRKVYILDNVITVDHTVKTRDGLIPSMIELCGLPDRCHIPNYMKQGVPWEVPIVYDTWHVRELLRSNNRRMWMESLLKCLVSEPDIIKHYHYGKLEYKQHVHEELEAQFRLFEASIGMFQIQTRSKEEAMRFIQGIPTMLGCQISLMSYFLHERRRLGRTVPKVVIEFLPFWSKSFKRKFFEAVKVRLGE